MTQFRTGYMDRALTDLGAIIDEAAEALADVDFDTIVGTGFSGGVVIPSLALRLGKNFVLIRKETDDSHHGQGKLLGVLGDRWIFVDDFISSGRTRSRVINKVAAAVVLEDTETTMAGQYMYCKRGQRRWNDEMTEWITDPPAFEPFNSEWADLAEMQS